MAQPIPPSASDWWLLFNLFIYIGVIAAAVTIGAMVHFAIKYRQRKGQPETRLQFDSALSRRKELSTLAVISAVLLFTLALASYRLTLSFQYPPSTPNTLTVDVTAFQWSFGFHYPNGADTVGQCYVPAGRPVVFNVTSSDVMHNFGLPDFKLKIDAIPGRYNTLWIVPPYPAANANLTYQIRCYELCGTGHTYMIGTLVVMEPEAFDRWLSKGGGNMTMGGG
ncbi:MAG: cytochrome c oxidase subunit II [Candidatus Bathyarchaeia archaeon]